MEVVAVIFLQQIFQENKKKEKKRNDLIESNAEWRRVLRMGLEMTPKSVILIPAFQQTASKQFIIHLQVCIHFLRTIYVDLE